MKKMEKLKTIGLVITILIIFLLIIYIFILKNFRKPDNDYQKLGLDLEKYNIDNCTIYDEDFFGVYKVYKLNMFGEDNIIRSMLENSKRWNKEKFYEYIMMKFYEKKDDEYIVLDREDLYYYHKNGIYAIFDIKNAKLYYSKNYIVSTYNEYNNILEIKINNYKTREIYDVRGGIQNDGRDYYVYEFNNEEGAEIVKEIEQSSKWTKNKLENDILNNFEYNSEVFSIKNGYYYYETLCRTSDVNKKSNYTEDEATGCEIGIYDIENNILYYYWESI